MKFRSFNYIRSTVAKLRRTYLSRIFITNVASKKPWPNLFSRQITKYCSVTLISLSLLGYVTQSSSLQKEEHFP